MLEHGAELQAADVLVLNGDIFDFRWSRLATEQATVETAIAWLRTLLNRAGNTEIHYILGNHDCLEEFRRPLEALVKKEPRLHCHEFWLRLDRRLFLHGDCVNRPMDQAGLEHNRRLWRQDKQRGWLRAAFYDLADVTGLSGQFHRRFFPRDRTVRRITYYLDRAVAGWREEIDDCYFGHTHMPFHNYKFQGICFHNTGSGIKGMEFQPLRFNLSAESAETAVRR